MNNKIRYIGKMVARDDNRLFIIRRDNSGGVNTRQHPTMIGENQFVTLTNVDIGVLGVNNKRPGSVLIADSVGSDTTLGLHNFVINGATDQLLMYSGTSLYKWVGSGTWASLKTNFSTATEVGMVSVKESGLSPDDVVIIQNGVDNAFRLDSAGNFQDLGSTSGTGSDSPPKSTVMCWYGNRLWVLKDTLLYFSDAYPSDYSTAFDTATNAFRIPVGDERGLVPTRDIGIIVLGKQAIWGIAPSTTPSPTSDQPQPLLVDYGCVSKKGWAVIGDDIYFFAQDGLRALKRTIQDKLQMGSSHPISYPLKDEFEEIDWSNIDKLSMKYFDNKLFISVPIIGGRKIWVYYPATNSFTILDGWNAYCWETYKISGELKLYYGHTSKSEVYNAWVGYTDEGTTTTNGTAVSMTIETREEDFGQPLIAKCGGEIEIEAVASGDYSFTVEAAINGGSYITLGTMNLNSLDAPTLPVNLPFTLSDIYIVRQKFHLDTLGEFRTLKIRLTNSDSNTEDIKVYSIKVVTYLQEYENEE